MSQLEIREARKGRTQSPLAAARRRNDLGNTPELDGYDRARKLAHAVVLTAEFRHLSLAFA